MPAPTEPLKTRSYSMSLVLKGLLKNLAFIALMALDLFATSGRLDWTMAWIYIILVALGSFITAWIVGPELVAERADVKAGSKSWDVPLAVIMALLGPLATLAVAGLDMRFGWSPPVSLALQVAALVVASLGIALIGWAMASNRFFSAVIRIQEERGHAVVSSGPYRYVRHPGYAGAILFQVATPLILGSLWAYIPSAITVLVIVLRTSLEDRTLKQELKGYRDYSDRVHYRLISKVW